MDCEDDYYGSYKGEKPLRIMLVLVLLSMTLCACAVSYGELRIELRGVTGSYGEFRSDTIGTPHPSPAHRTHHNTMHHPHTPTDPDLNPTHPGKSHTDLATSLIPTQPRATPVQLQNAPARSRDPEEETDTDRLS